MTLCELATARHHSPPLECAPFSFSEEFQFSDPPSGSPGNCVEWISILAPFWRCLTISISYRALSRSAQFWSSYSGYLREVRAFVPQFFKPCSHRQSYFNSPAMLRLSQMERYWSVYLLTCTLLRLWTSMFEDTAKEIYKNATLEKLALIRFVLQREEAALHHLHTSEVYLKVFTRASYPRI
jgi:hypothetical protein